MTIPRPVLDRLISPPTPRLLGAPMAAAYLGISPRAFEQRWRASKLPAPHRLGRRLLWDRKLLDKFVDKISGLDVQPDPPQDDW